MAYASAPHAFLSGGCGARGLPPSQASSGSALPLGYCLPTSLQLAKYWEAFLPEAKAIS